MVIYHGIYYSYKENSLEWRGTEDHNFLKQKKNVLCNRCAPQCSVNASSKFAQFHRSCANEPKALARTRVKLIPYRGKTVTSQLNGRLLDTR